MNHNTGIAAMPANQLSTKTAEIPRRLADIDASLVALSNRIETLGIKISPALNESAPTDPSPEQASPPPSSSQIEVTLYHFTQRIEIMIDDINRLIDRTAL